LDLPLSARGRQQLELAAARIQATSRPDALYTSPLRRAGDVAVVLGEAWGLQPRVLEAAREIHCGSAEGMRLDILQQQYPEMWARNAAQVDDDFAWPGGESYRQFRQRVLAACSEAAAGYDRRRVVLVTHAGVISQVLGLISNRPAAVWQPDRPDPLSATEVAWVDDAPRAVLSYNVTHWY
jgi:broad specificity phosphatase PhoE